MSTPIAAFSTIAVVSSPTSSTLSVESADADADSDGVIDNAVAISSVLSRGCENLRQFFKWYYFLPENATL